MKISIYKTILIENMFVKKNIMLCICLPNPSAQVECNNLLYFFNKV